MWPFNRTELDFKITQTPTPIPSWCYRVPSKCIRKLFALMDADNAQPTLVAKYDLWSYVATCLPQIDMTSELGTMYIYHPNNQHVFVRQGTPAQWDTGRRVAK